MRCAACGQENPDGFTFCGHCGAALAAPAAPREVRKVVTVVFCDLTGSTALGSVTDPEALRSTMRSYYSKMRAILERHGGTVEKFVGDAVMAVFGVPVAHEDDALRAVRAAWEMRAAVPALGLQARIGVNTGEVVTGEGDTLVTGDAVNVAARLEQGAGPGEVLVGPETRRLVRDAVRVEPATIAAKGKGELQAFRLLEVDVEAAAIARRLDTPLVGRVAELEQLVHAFERAVRERRCHLFTLLGAAGVGKSRLVAELLGRLDATVVEGRCLDYGEGITFWPVVSILKQLGPRADATLQRVVEGGRLPNEIPWAVRTFLEEVAVERPLVVVFDDVQWGEETFLDLVDHVADLSRGAPILLLCVARPELLDKRPGWGGGKLNATTVLLEPLSAEESAELITVHGGVDPDVRERIVATADGNPLFVEEMVALVHEDGDVRIPSTVQALLQARIDQLAGDERVVIERGAVEGQLFHREAVAQLTQQPDVDPQLAGLVRKELIHPAPATLAGDQAYRFRHLLIRDAAYDALPKETRAELHELFADWLLEHGRALIELDEIVGYHLEQAARYHGELGHPRDELAARAGAHLAAAGRRAAERGDLPGGRKLLTRAVALLPGRSREWESAFLDRLSLLAADPSDAELAAALEELEQSGDERLALHARLTRLKLGIEAADEEALRAAPSALDEATARFEEADDHRGLSTTAEVRALLAWLRSNARDAAAAMDDCDEHARRAEIVYFRGRHEILRLGPLVWGPFTPEETRARLAGLGPDDHARVVIETQIAEREGRYEEGVALAEEMRMSLLEMGLRVLSTAPMTARAELLRRMGRLEDSVAAYEELIAVHTGLGQASYLSTALIDYARTRYDLGEHEEAERLAAEGERLGLADDVINFSRSNSLRAMIAADRGDDEAALGFAATARDFAFRTDFPSEHGRTYEMLGHVHARAGRTAEARAEYEQALELWQRYGWTADAERVRGLLVEL